MESKVFDRIEKKYLVTAEQKRALLKLIKHNMKKDGYHKSGVMNLYFDNDQYDLTIQSIDWVDFKEKVRARSYDGYDRVFMEVKTKTKPPKQLEKHQEYEDQEDNIGYKRRVMITHDDFNELINHNTTLENLAKRSIETENDIQIAKEIDYLIQRFDLKPKIYISYDRESYKDEHGLRITFDEHLKYRDKNLSFIKGKRDKIYFKDDRNIVMEVKADGVMPLWLVHKLSELEIYPQQFSKIGKIYQIIKKGTYV